MDGLPSTIIIIIKYAVDLLHLFIIVFDDKALNAVEKLEIKACKSLASPSFPTATNKLYFVCQDLYFLFYGEQQIEIYLFNTFGL